ncbi:hypothetical protein EVAR_79114_1 [Eumeta japonica]|uniref:Uncharacterized protein n=1 Tax=Eumeta variegata TaxID=151549 RepID=A0A4C1WZP9_EUMVA|nr:hypothetical protein EVAR_79114_1 [Eumeta japonica]
MDIRNPRGVTNLLPAFEKGSRNMRSRKLGMKLTDVDYKASRWKEWCYGERNDNGNQGQKMRLSNSSEHFP